MSSPNRSYLHEQMQEIVAASDPLHEGLLWHEIDSVTVPRSKVEEWLGRIGRLQMVLRRIHEMTELETDEAELLDGIGLLASTALKGN